MHHRLSRVIGKSLLATSLVVVTSGLAAARADDEGFFSRLFRGGSSSTSGNSNASRSAGAAPYGRSTPNAANGGQPAENYFPQTGSNYGGLTQTPVTTPPNSTSGPTQRLSPRPRVSNAVTSADPLVTRLALGRSNDGSQFGMFLQIFADGTVIDSEGVHRLRPADLKPIMDLLQSGDLYRARGHCGSPATDFIDYVNVVVYERRLGRLMAHSLSYSGNPQGCDHAVRHLHTALENIQVKLSRSAGGTPTPAGSTGNGSPLVPGATPAIDRQPNAPAVNPAQGPEGAVIPLTPVDPSR